FSVSNVWVPKSYRFDLQNPSPILQSPLYRFPFMKLAEINMLVMASGLAIHFYELVQSIAKEKMAGGSKGVQEVALSDIPEFKEVSLKNSSSFLKNRKYTFRTLDELWKEVCEEKEISSNLSDQF